MTIYRATDRENFDAPLYFRADFRHASDPIFVCFDDEITADTDWHPTQYQVADARHDPERAALLLGERQPFIAYHYGKHVGYGDTEDEALENAIADAPLWFGYVVTPEIEAELRETVYINRALIDVEPLEWQCACEHCDETAEDPEDLREGDDGQLYCDACVEYQYDYVTGYICAAHGTGCGWPRGSDDDVCPECGDEILWGRIETHEAGRPNDRAGGCECSTWHQEERGGKWTMPTRTPREVE